MRNKDFARAEFFVGGGLNVAESREVVWKRGEDLPVENFRKNYKKIIQKVVDVSVSSTYNRDSS